MLVFGSGHWVIHHYLVEITQEESLRLRGCVSYTPGAVEKTRDMNRGFNVGNLLLRQNKTCVTVRIGGIVNISVRRRKKL